MKVANRQVDIDRKTAQEMTIEYHHDMNRWFVSRVEDGRYTDYAIEQEQADEIQPHEIQIQIDETELDELMSRYDSDPWTQPEEITKNDALYMAWKIGRSIELRGVKYRVASFAGHYCGYDLSRFQLTAQ